MKKSTSRTILIIVAVVLALVGIAGMCFTILRNVRETNPDNLLNVDNYVATLEDKRDDDIEIDVSKTGEITVKGENDTNADIEIMVQEVTLAKGEYTISSGAWGTDDEKYYLCARTGEGESAVTIIADDGDKSTFKVEADDTVYTVYIVICDDVTVNATFKPVLVADDEAGSFYVYEN